MSVHQPHPPVGPAGPAAAPRKRRRRALATGAAEDCFTCRINGTKCDRRRPYCGPCLDIGNECTGYRTQLTWGVGVASRGKLRGMTLPVPIESNISVTERDRRCAVKEKSVSKTALRAQRSRIAPEASNHPSSNGDIEERSITTNYDFVNMEHPSATSAINSAVAKHDFPQTSKSPTFTEPNATSMVNTSLMMQSSYPPPPQHPQRNLEYPSAVLNYHKPSYSRDSMNSNSPGVMASSTLSEYDSTYTPHSGSPYSLSPSPSDSSIYDGSLMVSSAYLPPSSLSLTSSMPSYAPLVTSTHLASQFMDGHNVPQHRNYHWGHMGLNQQEVSAVEGNLPDLLCDDEMLGTF